MKTEDEKNISKREQKKREKWDRIMEVSLELFQTKPFNEITTKELADRAEIPIGTFFRYVNSKQDLLIRVFSARIEYGLELSEERLQAGQPTLEVISAVVEPFAQLATNYLENAVAYGQAVQFGPVGSPIRDHAIASINSFSRQVVRALRIRLANNPHVKVTDIHATITDNAAVKKHSVNLEKVAHSIYATMYMDVVQVTVERTRAEDLIDTARRHIDFQLKSFFPGVNLDENPPVINPSNR